MSQQTHPLLPTETHDETARESFVQALKSHIATRVSPGVREIYDRRVRGQWVDEHGAEPADRHEVREALSSDTYYRLWSSVRRSSQHLLWSSVSDAISRQAPELAERARAADAGLGSLRLDPDLEIPWYNAEVDIHAMPGGYRGEYMDDDVSVGALFDRGVYVYAMGQMGALNDDYGQSVCQNFLAVSYPEFSPRRILDMGCTSGNSTLPYVDAFPDAEVHAIDLGAPVLRYAHARAESLGRAVHFSQQNAECTDFPDGHFDLIVSHIVIQRDVAGGAAQGAGRMPTPAGTGRADGARRLRPDMAGVDPVTQAMIDWDTYNNHEPFWGPMRDMDLVAESVSAGFDDGAVELTSVPTGRMLQTGKQQKTGQLTLLVGRA